jgi:hypothetical protein
MAAKNPGNCKRKSVDGQLTCDRCELQRRPCTFTVEHNIQTNGWWNLILTEVPALSHAIKTVPGPLLSVGGDVEIGEDEGAEEDDLVEDDD